MQLSAVKGIEKQMRTSDIPYVRNPARYYPPVALEEMSLKEIVDKHIKTCAKANGQVSVCSHCLSQCQQGKRALELVSGNKAVEEPVPLFDGKTMLELARQQNEERRAKMEKAEEIKPRKVSRKDWYEEAKASGDPVQWIMDNLGLSRTKAQNKIYQYRYYLKTKGATRVENVAPETEVKVPQAFDSKLETLRSMKEQHEKMMTYYLENYQEEEKIVKDLEAKIDVLCKAMDIMSEKGD